MSDENLRLNEGQGKKVRTQINASFSDEDMAILDELKKMLGLSTTGVIKLLIREGLQNRKDTRNANYTRKLL